MGSAFCGISDDVNAVYWNPAGLSLLRRQEISGLHISLWEETFYDSLSYAYPINDCEVFGFGVIRLSTGGIEKRESPFDTASTFDCAEMGFFATYSRNIWKKNFVWDKFKRN